MTADDNKPSGDQTSINTGGGDYAGRDIDKRQGTFITIQHSTPLSPALHQLRAPVGDFVGREREIDQLVEVLSKAASGGAAAISGVRGMGGIGKTELAYVVAHRLKDGFPDAQLVVELRGASEHPTPTTHALQTIIRAFERDAKLPDDVTELQGIYRSHLTGKRVLVVADDAKDKAQVQPLIPPAGCALLITSRRHFSLPGMLTLNVRALPAEEAEQLLQTICPRIGTHARELAQLCGYLPLALRVSASMLANSSRAMPRYLEQLRAARLAYLTDPDDLQASVAASLQLSYAALSPASQQALTQLSVFPASFDVAAAQAVIQVEGDIEAILDQLTQCSILEWDEQKGRYSLHDLVRSFVAAQLPDVDTTRVAFRHARHYTKVTWHAEKGLYRKGQVRAGLALFDQERAHIDAGWIWALAHAGQPKTDALLIAYARATVNLAPLRYDTVRERLPRLEAWLRAARRQGQQSTEGYALNNLGNIYSDLGEVDKALSYYEQSLTVFRAIGDQYGEALPLSNLGSMYLKLGEVGKATAYYEQSLAIRRAIGDRHREGWSLYGLGNIYLSLGEVRKAMVYYEQSLNIAREFGDLLSEAHTSWSLGLACKQQGDLVQAVALMQTCVDYEREIGHPEAEKHAAYVDHLRQRLAGRISS